MQFKAAALNCGCKNRNLHQFYHMILRIKVRLFISLIMVGVSATFADAQNALIQADSLFENQRYTQAYELYEQLFNEGRASSSMLLKMAFIRDASGNYTDAIYYLDHYYRMTADREVIGKISEIATQNNLSGYQYSDWNYFENLLNKFQIRIALLLCAFMMLILAYQFRQSRRNYKSYLAGLTLVLLGICLNRLIDFEPANQAIIVADQTLLRSGPSAGAEPIQIIQKGHRVKVLDTSDVWIKIKWDGEEVYVRKDRLKII